jgi:hypothetical protein
MPPYPGDANLDLDAAGALDYPCQINILDRLALLKE